MKEQMTTEEFQQLLRQHDWYYIHDKDHAAYRKGNEEHQRISKLIKESNELMDIYTNHVKGGNNEHKK